MSSPECPVTDGVVTPTSPKAIDVEAVRFRSELTFADQLVDTGVFENRLRPEQPDAERVRRRLLSTHLKLSPNMAPEVFDYASQAAEVLGIKKPIEIYQVNGEENAANWRCSEVVFISLQGQMTSLLDRDTFVAMLGHEIGHHLAHTDSFANTRRQDAMDCATGIACDPQIPDEVRVLASRLAMAREFTADRFAALATATLDGPLRLMMSIVTGLPSERLRADADTYLAQARALFEGKDDSETPSIGSHPEHLLRAYALSLFVESDVFQALTGKGFGGRQLAEVDARLERILVGSEGRVFESDKDRALPSEIQEFILCAASLMATADGELDESELKSLEDTFSSLLPNWKELLDSETALARFGELLPLAVAGGEPVASSVFSVLVHVMLADGEIHVRELEVLSAVGRSLRQEVLFECLLGAVAHSVRVRRNESPVEKPLPALPPGRHEARAALSGLFAGMSRRGGGSTSLQRLLRIMGRKMWDAEADALLRETLASHQLTLVAPPLRDEQGNIQSDQTLKFQLLETEQARRLQADTAGQGGELATAQTRDALMGSLKHLRERLVSGDGRSPSIRLYRASTGRHFDLAALDRVISGRADRIATLLNESNVIPVLSGEEAGLHKTATETARTLRSLEREFKARVEETGCRDLFVGYPFLVGMVGSYFVRAPLILHPFSLVGDGKGAGSFTLRRRETDPASANQALIRLLFAKKGFPFTDALAAKLDTKAAEGCEALLEELRQIGLDAQPLSGSITSFEAMTPSGSSLLPEGISLAENAVVGFFPQSSSDLLQDYDELLARLDPSSADSLEHSLNAASPLLPARYRPEFKMPPGSDGPDQPIIYADPSQRSAVRQSRTSRLMVMDGPPGTGKSQTIVNLVADALAKGERVAIICEKRVALDVVKQRLVGAGIGHLSAVVHDVYDDRKALYTHIADRLEVTERRTFVEDALSVLRAEARRLEDQISQRNELMASATGSGFVLGALHVMAASFDVPPIASPGLTSLDHPALLRLLKSVKELQPFARFWNPCSVFLPGDGMPDRPLLASESTAGLHTILQNLRAAKDAAFAYGNYYGSQPLDPETLESAEPVLRLVTSMMTKSSPDKATLGRMTALRLRNPSAVAPTEQALEILADRRAAAEAETTRVEMEESNALIASLSIAARHANTFWRFLFPSWRKACTTLREALVKQWPEQAGAKMDVAFLSALTQRVQAAGAWRAADTLFKTVEAEDALPRKATDLYARVDVLRELWNQSKQLAQSKEALETFGCWPALDDDSQMANAWSTLGTQCQSALEQLAARRTYLAAVQCAAQAFPQTPYLAPEAVNTLVEQFAEESQALCSADRILAAMQSMLPDALALAKSLAGSLPDAPASIWADAVARGWAEGHIAVAESQNPAISILDKEPPLGSLEKASARLLELHQAIAKEESHRLAAVGDRFGIMAFNAAEPRARRSPEQAARENLIRECRKQRNVTPMRTLVRRYAKEGILDVVPVWLMSPETTAILFPREPVFDLLIIDEASQCTVETGLPVLTRARRAVIAGDDKQMPPSSFFKAAAGITAMDTEFEGDEEPPVDVPLDAFESESLLALARNDNTGAPLRWHYRALYEELIAFSNHSMYGGSLLTIPSILSRSAPAAVRWVRIENGTWDKGANLPEAKRVVDLLADLLARPSPPSIGIVTFNIQQRRVVLDEIDARRMNDPEFAERIDTAMSAELMDARPFVKNLESVQGDERDVIIFSLGYAPVQRKKRDGSEETYVPARFGPLGQKGGERRLNVAVSRAKTEIVVVSSFDPAMLSVAHTKHDGPRMFKAFVEFARHLGEGRRNQAEKILSLVNDAPRRQSSPKPAEAPTTAFLSLHHQVALELEKTGLTVETMVGSSEFRLPVAVVSNGQHDRYALALLCEDGTSSNEVYEDYVHVPNVLAHRKWRHLRINSRDWHRERSRVIERIKDMLSSLATIPTVS